MSTELSRRNFLAGAATLSALAGAAALVGCGSSTTAADAGAAEATAADATAWLGAAPGIAEFADEQTADVVVVGAGTGGMFAAAAAAEGGASVIVIEKGEDYGSVKDDLGAVNTKLQQEDGTTFDRAQMMLDYYRYSNARTDLRLFNAWFDNSAETVDWFTDLIAAKGVTMWHEAAVGDQEGLVAHWATGHSPAWPEDKDKKINGATVLGEYIQGLGGQIVFSMPMVELAVENGKVTGVVAQNADGGTRTASISGAYVALYEAISWGISKGIIAASSPEKVLSDSVSAISVGIIDGTPMLDLPYVEDVRAQTDMNVVQTGSGSFVEVQGTAEHALFSRTELGELLDLATAGNAQIRDLQARALAAQPGVTVSSEAAL